ncbi:MAG: 3-oxoacyl-[acyl-carrier-protein] synthase 3 [Candidatus Dichloromethanomonas elyunquensis]|nr:MAG: 3-oxoacyl-[acyl-carrier-protein] synthase 3 [Candidatus Dichloromethanomonas elyunquensis]
MYDVEIVGTGSFVPENRVTNEDISKFVDTSDEWISERTGIKERRISISENTSDLAFMAARRALDDAGISPEEVDLIILATITPDYFFPSTACLVQAKLGAHKATSFDISAACSGFIFGLTVAEQFINTGVYQTVLVIGAEVLSKIVDWNDRSTSVLFGDGAGAAVLKRGKQGIISRVTGCDGSGAASLACPAVPLKNAFCDFSQEKANVLTMNGREIFKFAVKIMPECVEKVLEDSGHSIDEIRYIIPHQANIRLVDAAVKKLQINQEKVYINIQRFGNTSGASIALALDEMSRGGLLRNGDLLILVGFGSGLTYGAMLLKWTKEGNDNGEEKNDAKKD